MTSPSDVVSQETAAFYRGVVELLQQEDVPFLVAGAFAFARYTGIVRHTKDFDLFLRREDLDRAFAALEGSGCATELTSSHWLGKAQRDKMAIDLIFATGNGVSQVDAGWFDRARRDEALGISVLLAAPEDILWTKAFIQERERFDGADVAHLLLSADLDWDLLLDHFRPHWRVLLAHVILFDFIYPSERDRIPASVREALYARLADPDERQPGPRVCNGTLLSRAQYLVDVDERGFRDGRLEPEIRLTAAEVDAWTRAIEPPGANGA